MPSSSEPPLVPPATTGNMTDCVAETAREDPGHVSASRKLADGRWRDVTAAEFLGDVMGVAKGLLAAGITPGDRVGIMARTSYEWTLVDVAGWFAGAVTVPVYETSSPEQLEWILSDSGAVACFVETSANAARIASVRDRLPGLRDVWTLESGGLEELRAAGREVPDADVDRSRAVAGPGDALTVIYTSGTTGRPKGCVLTHGNFLDLSRNAEAAIPEVLRRPDAATLLFIPLAHVFARFIQALCLVCRIRVGHTPDAKDLLPDLGGFRPTFILAVPRVFQKVYNGAEQKAAAGGKLRARIFEQAAATADAWSRSLDTGGPSPALRVRHLLFDRLVYSKLRALMGGRVEFAVSGGAPMGEHLAHFFRGAGLVVLEGYGLTETTAPLTVNRPSRLKIGTVGPPLPGTDLRLAPDGEVEARGVGVFTEYRGRPDETRDAFDDGWFRTGDLGSIDEDGLLRITGRKKEIIVTANGKNVVPAALEDRLRAHPLISQAVVVGDQRHYVGCLLTLDEEALPSWGANHGKPGLDLGTARADADVLAVLQAAVDKANESVSRAESIRKFRVLTEDFTVENGYLTPSLKVKRHEVLHDLADEVEALYSS
ncbi:long-chain fatty acid--CoA ligase [Kineococcus endophyticus]|uniref:Acyl-CoA synthetase n=1 Tax=Kineococcus endophyticus TaxID=1181883 RepID=A0ABV3P1N5_9ACTN